MSWCQRLGNCALGATVIGVMSLPWQVTLPVALATPVVYCAARDKEPDGSLGNSILLLGVGLLAQVSLFANGAIKITESFGQEDKRVRIAAGLSLCAIGLMSFVISTRISRAFRRPI